MPPRLVLLSDHKPHALRLAQGLAERGVPLQAVLLTSGDVLPLRAGFKPWALSVAEKARRIVRFYRRHRPFYAPLGTRLIATGEVNSEAMRRDLERLAPDYIIMGIGVILKPPIIETARCGVLNVHPGLLPWVRGGGVVDHALGSRVPVGATLHFIDAGIDTGAIIERRLLPITKAAVSIAALTAANDKLAARLLVDHLEMLAKTGGKPAATPQTARFPLFRWPELAARPAFEELAQQGRALELFNAWKGVCRDEETWSLPPELTEAPATISIRPL